MNILLVVVIVIAIVLAILSGLGSALNWLLWVAIVLAVIAVIVWLMRLISGRRVYLPRHARARRNALAFPPGPFFCHFCHGFVLQRLRILHTVRSTLDLTPRASSSVGRASDF